MSTAATPGDFKIFLQRLKRVLGANPDTDTGRGSMRQGAVREIWGGRKGFVWPKKEEGYTRDRRSSRTCTVTLSKSDWSW